MDQHTISFAVLDDLKFVASERLPFEKEEEEKEIVIRWFQRLQTDDYNYLYFCGSWDHDKMFKNLWKNRYLVFNRVKKYYVVAFAIDDVTFHVYSKDFEAQVIDWSSYYTHINDGSYVGTVPPEDYQVSPIIKLIAALCNQ